MHCLTKEGQPHRWSAEQRKKRHQRGRIKDSGPSGKLESGVPYMQNSESGGGDQSQQNGADRRTHQMTH
ncbi:MAG TPA: hypothetical protein VGX94_06205 [Terriglobia bacterium]|nr:hypothetical protein [Terriglobia bacterium]